jgi:CHASE2 domain-containing sensor protein
VLAALLGGFLAGRHRQPLAAVLVAVLGAAYGLLLLPIAHLLPATVPIGLALLMLESVDTRRAATRERTAGLASALRSAG